MHLFLHGDSMFRDARARWLTLADAFMTCQTGSVDDTRSEACQCGMCGVCVCVRARARACVRACVRFLAPFNIFTLEWVTKSEQKTKTKQKKKERVWERHGKPTLGLGYSSSRDFLLCLSLSGKTVLPRLLCLDSNPRREGQ